MNYIVFSPTLTSAYYPIPSFDLTLFITFQLSLPLFPFIRGEVLPATFSPPRLLFFSTLLCLLSSSSSLPPLLSSSHLSLHSPPISVLASLVSSCPAHVTLPLSSVVCHPPSFLRVLLAAFFFWPYRCFKLVGGCSPLSLMHSIIFHASRFSPTAFATSSVHHPWFLLLGVPPFPDVLPHSSSANPTNASLYFLHSPSTVPFSASSSSYFLLTLFLYSTIISSILDCPFSSRQSHECVDQLQMHHKVHWTVFMLQEGSYELSSMQMLTTLP